MTFIKEQTEAGASGLRALKTPGDPQWCWQTISHLQTLWQSLTLDYDLYIRTWEEAEEHKVWEKVPYEAPFGSKEEMLRQLSIGDDKQAQKSMEVQSIAARARRLLHQGGTREKAQTYGTTRDRLLVRILRESPDVFERWERGEFTSVPEAARAAGIELTKAKRKVTLGNDVGRLAEAIHSHYSSDQVSEFALRILQLRRQSRH